MYTFYYLFIVPTARADCILAIYAQLLLHVICMSWMSRQ